MLVRRGSTVGRRAAKRIDIVVKLLFG